jgi:hypothetical protein
MTWVVLVGWFYGNFVGSITRLSSSCNLASPANFPVLRWLQRKRSRCSPWSASRPRHRSRSERRPPRKAPGELLPVLPVAESPPRTAGPVQCLPYPAALHTQTR